MRQDCDDWDGIVVDDAGPDLGVEAVVDREGGGRIRYVGLAGNWNLRATVVAMIGMTFRVRPRAVASDAITSIGSTGSLTA